MLWINGWTICTDKSIVLTVWTLTEKYITDHMHVHVNFENLFDV